LIDEKDAQRRELNLNVTPDMLNPDLLIEDQGNEILREKCLRERHGMTFTMD